MKCATTLILVVLADITVAEIKLPSFIAQCRAKDGLCLKKVLKELAPHLSRGIPELNVPSLDPAFLPDYNQTDFSSTEMPYIAIMKDLKYTGASNFEILKLDIDLDELIFNLELFFPQLTMKAYEIVRLKSFGFDVDGEGLTIEYYKNVTINFSLHGAKYLGNGKKYVKWMEDRISISLGGYSYEVDPSFTDADDYLNYLNRATREYPDLFYPEVDLYVKNTIGRFIFQTINAVHEAISIDVLYIPDKIRNVL